MTLHRPTNHIVVKGPKGPKGRTFRDIEEDLRLRAFCKAGSTQLPPEVAEELQATQVMQVIPELHAQAELDECLDTIKPA